MSSGTLPIGVWNSDTLEWERMKQPILNAGSVSTNLTGTGLASESTINAINSNTARLKLLPFSGTASSEGNNLAVTPSPGKKLRLSYLSYAPVAAVTCAWRFGASGALFLQNPMPATGILGKDIGDMRYIEGAIDEPLYLNLSGAVATIWNCFYIEV